MHLVAGLAALCLTAPGLAQEGTPVAAQSAELRAVLALTAQYIEDYETRLAGIVAEDGYTQNVRTIGSARGRGQLPPVTHRTMRSDLLLVRPTGEGPWLPFRDVFEVDGKPLRDRDERLLKLFVDTKADARAQAQSIAEEGARYNIGPVTRTINVPVLGLTFFSRENQPHARFIRVSPGNPKRFAGVPVQGEVWAIEFREFGPGTLVRGAAGSDLPSRGRAWVERETGRILNTEHIAEDTRVTAKVEATYGAQEGLDLLVPVEMKESYAYRQTPVRIFGEATYGRFRRFKVTTDEKPKPPPGSR
jgi:hypothetical protein